MTTLLRWPLTSGPGQTPTRTVRRISTRLPAPTRREGGYGPGRREEAQGGEEKREREHGREGSGEPGQHPDDGHADDQTGVARREEGRYGMTTPLGRRQAVGGGQAAQKPAICARLRASLTRPPTVPIRRSDFLQNYRKCSMAIVGEVKIA